MDKDKENILTEKKIKTWKRDLDRDIFTEQRQKKRKPIRADQKLTDRQN